MTNNGEVRLAINKGDALEGFLTTLDTIADVGTLAILNNDASALADLYETAGNLFLSAAAQNRIIALETAGDTPYDAKTQ